MANITPQNSLEKEKKELLKLLDCVLHGKENSPTTHTHQPSFQVKRPEKVKKDLVKIHVYDKEKEQRKIFQYPRDVSLSKLGLFSDKWSSKGDLHVECNIEAFHWILRWLAKEKQLLNSDLLHPVIEAASTLDAPLLLTTCLLFWRANVRFVMGGGEWESFDENVVTRLANLHNNCSLEELSEDVPKLQEVLYQKFILFLCEPTVRPSLGHYASLAQLFMCRFCKQILGNTSHSAPCQFAIVNPLGGVSWGHSYDPDWSLCKHLVSLKEKYKRWRLVYWNLWASCHRLFCSTCLEWFPLSEMSRCYFHSKEKKEVVGRSRTQQFDCCLQSHFHFQTVQKVLPACESRDHTPVLPSQSEQEVIKIFKSVRKCIDFETPPKRIKKIRMAPGPSGKILDEKLSIIKLKYLQPNTSTLLSTIPPKILKNRKKIKGYWWPGYSIGWNQDNQRDQEEMKMRTIQQMLSRNDKEYRTSQSLAGSYINAEVEWWSNQQGDGKHEPRWAI